MRSRSAIVVLMLVLSAASMSACANPTAPAAAVVDRQIRSFESQVSVMGRLFDSAFPGTDSEPRFDVPSGMFMCVIDRVATDTAGVAVRFDIVSTAGIPGNDLRVWNKYQHPQVACVARNSALGLPGELGQSAILSPQQFATKWASNPGLTGQSFFMVLWRGEVQAVWAEPCQ
jgi:hypothetical protein